MKQAKRQAHAARMKAAQSGKARRAAKAQVFTTPKAFVPRADSELPRVTFAVAKAQVQAAMPEAKRQMSLTLGRLESERQAAQAERMGQLAVLAMLFGTPEDAGYLARCAFRLARNSDNLLDTGFPATDGFVAWVNQRRADRSH